jgi:hypothetical protein
MERDKAAPVIRGGLARLGEIWFVADQRDRRAVSRRRNSAERDSTR